MSADEFVRSGDLRIGYIKRPDEVWRPVIYEAVDGLAIFEGCIILGAVVEMEKTAEIVRSQPLLLKVPDAQEQGIIRAGKVFRWPGKKVFYEIDPMLPNQTRVTDAVAHWETNTEFRFVLRNGEPNFVRFRPGGGCSSSVGMQGGQQFVTLGPG